MSEPVFSRCPEYPHPDRYCAICRGEHYVPVEPDYEAAALVGNGHDYIKRVLDAAYGIGGDDEAVS